ncbi:FecR family protein [Pseudomonas putida]
MPTPSAPESSDPRISDEAAQWCIRLNEPDFSEQERHQLQQWLNSDPAHQREFDTIREIWTISQYLPPEVPVPPGVVMQPLAAPARRRRYRRPLMAAAVLAFVLPMAGLIGWQLNLVPDSYQRFESDGTLRDVILADGSHVQLNLDSQLSFANYKDRRSVTLSKGEAYFEVQHDASHPFLVDAGKGQVRVTGTHFNVWTYRDEVMVTLTQGSVQVTGDRSRPGLVAYLSPGMQAHFDPAHSLPTVSAAPLATALAWRDGKLILGDMTLSDALPQINRYLPSPVHLGDRATGQLRVGGIYDTQDIAALVNDLPKALPVYLTRNEEGETVIRSKRGYLP